MQHGYLVLTYGSAEAALRQVEALDAPGAFFFFHWDKKTTLDRGTKQFRSLCSHPRVHVLPDEQRVKVQWGSFRIVEATLRLMRAGLQTQGIDRFHLLSGECLPVKPPRYIDDYFAQRPGTEAIAMRAMPTRRISGWGPNRYDKYHLHDFFNPRSTAAADILVRHLNGLLRKTQRVLKPLGIYRRYGADLPPVHAGHQWWSLSRDCCSWLIRYIDTHPVFVRRFRYTQAPDEMFFHTALAAGPFAAKATDNNLRFVRFSEGAGTHAVSLTEDALSHLRAEDVLFARKFTSESAALIQQLEQEGLLQKGQTAR